MVFRLQIALDRVASPTRAGPGLPGEWSPNGCSKVKVEGDQAVVRAPGIKNQEIRPSLMFLLKPISTQNMMAPSPIIC